MRDVEKVFFAGPGTYDIMAHAHGRAGWVPKKTNTQNIQ